MGRSEDDADGADADVPSAELLSYAVEKPPSDFVEAHPLKYSWTFWFNRRLTGARTPENYEKHIKNIGTFGSVELFWAFYNHMVRPNELPSSSDYHLFRAGVKPMWEDDANKLGGKWIVRLKKGLASKYWEDLVLSLIGNQFDPRDNVNGVVMSVRYHEDIISIWNQNADDSDAKIRIHNTCKRVLQLPPGTAMEYKCHDASIKDQSSYRNTDIFRSRTNQQREHGGGGGGGGGGGYDRGDQNYRDQHYDGRGSQGDGGRYHSGAPTDRGGDRYSNHGRDRRYYNDGPPMDGRGSSGGDYYNRRPDNRDREYYPRGNNTGGDRGDWDGRERHYSKDHQASYRYNKSDHRDGGGWGRRPNKPE